MAVNGTFNAVLAGMSVRTGSMGRYSLVRAWTSGVGFMAAAAVAEKKASEADEVRVGKQLRVFSTRREREVVIQLN